MWTTVSIRIIAKLNPTSRTLSPNHNLVKAREVPQLVGYVQCDDGQKFTDSRRFTTPVIGSEESCKSPDLDTLARCILHTLYLRGNLGTPDYPGVPPNSMRREPAYRFKYFVPLRRGPVREFQEQSAGTTLVRSESSGIISLGLLQFLGFERLRIQVRFSRGSSMPGGEPGD